MIKLLIKLIPILIFISCANQQKINTDFEIRTPFGIMGVVLYDEVENHAKEINYLIENNQMSNPSIDYLMKDSLIQFNFSFNKKNSILDYSLAPEISNKYIVKKGTLITNSKINDKNNFDSSVDQIFIITGKKYNQSDLDTIEEKINRKKFNRWLSSKIADTSSKEYQEMAAIMKELKIKNDTSISPSQQSAINIYRNNLFNEWKEKGNEIKYSDKKRKTYQTIGGIPHLDGQVTVIGEIAYGMEVLEKLNKINTDVDDVPYQYFEIEISNE